MNFRVSGLRFGPRSGRVEFQSHLAGSGFEFMIRFGLPKILSPLTSGADWCKTILTITFNDHGHPAFISWYPMMKYIQVITSETKKQKNPHVIAIVYKYTKPFAHTKSSI